MVLLHEAALNQSFFASRSMARRLPYCYHAQAVVRGISCLLMHSRAVNGRVDWPNSCVAARRLHGNLRGRGHLPDGRDGRGRGQHEGPPMRKNRRTRKKEYRGSVTLTLTLTLPLRTKINQPRSALTPIFLSLKLRRLPKTNGRATCALTSAVDR